MHMRIRFNRRVGFLSVLSLCLFSILVYLYVIDHEVEGWNPSVSRKVTDYIDLNRRFPIVPEHICKLESYLMIVVCSAPKNFEARNVIRDTWGSVTDDAKVKVYFLIGKTLDEELQNKIEEESETYNDIVQETFLDTYNNLTLKTIALTKLVTNFCTKSVKYVMKCDDDTFVNVEHLLQMIETRNITQNLLVGYKMCHVKPTRFVFNKWYTPRYLYSDEVFPDFISGTGYVTSVDVLPSLLKTAINTPILHLEDVYMTGICAKRAGIESIHDYRFNYVKRVYEPCLYQDLITTHYFKPPDMRMLYEKLKSSNPKEECDRETKGSYTPNTESSCFA